MSKDIETKISNVNIRISEIERKYKRMVKLYDSAVQKISNMEVEALSTNASLKLLCLEDIGTNISHLGIDKGLLTDGQKCVIQNDLYEKYKKEALEQAEKDDGTCGAYNPFADANGDVKKEPIREEYKGYDLSGKVKK